MRCLDYAQIQAAADGEATAEIHDHVRSCAGCSKRVRERQQQIAADLQALAVTEVIPPRARERFECALQDGPAGGATRLRRDVAVSYRSRRQTWSVVAVAAATLLLIVFVAPMIKEPATLSASEILAKSATRLAQTAAAGVEFLDYELTLDGVPRELMPDHPSGTYRVKQVIDHAAPDRYRFSTYASDGQLLSAVAQDPATGRRVMTVRLDGQDYRFEFSLPASSVLSLPEIEHLHMEATVAMMQASGIQQLQVVDSPSGRQYRIDVPRVNSSTTGAVWDLNEAQVVIDADNYVIVELAAKGTFLKQPYSISYRLIGRETKPQADVSADEFRIAEEPGAITLRGEGTAIPARDALVVALRELAKPKPPRP